MLQASPHRRARPRVPVQSLCSEIWEDSDRYSLVVDLSEDGLRVQRPVGGHRSRILQLEFEVPGIDELIWAKGEICFDEVWSVPTAEFGDLSGMLRTSGIRIVSAASRHQRLLRDYVNDTWRQTQRIHQQLETEWMYRASCYLRG